MKRKIASRKLKRTCTCCDKSFVKDDVYYLKRMVFKDYYEDEIIAYEYLTCARCKYENERSSERHKRFIESGKCHHPVTDEIWTTIAGEEHVKEPSHTECLICGKRV